MKQPTSAFALLVMLVGVAAGPATAQTPGAGVVVGAVRDSISARPLAGVHVILLGDGVQRATRSDETGGFRFHDTPAGTHVLQVRSIGYAPWFGEVRATESGATISVSLVRIAALDTVRATAGRGVYGVVGDLRTLTPLRNAEVQVVGARATVRTDSSGRFFVPLRRPGAYMVRAFTPGHEMQTMSVTVAGDASVEVALLLDTTSVGMSNRHARAWDEFDERMRRRGRQSAFVTSQELAPYGNLSAVAALQNTRQVLDRALRFGDEACVFVDGMPTPSRSVFHYDAEMIEAIEVYEPGAEASRTLEKLWPRGVPCPSTGLTRTMTREASLVKWVVIWLKR